jgi:hypothetical protein
MLHGFHANHVGAEKHVQEDKKKRRHTMLDWGLFSVLHILAMIGKPNK